jgi:hypothetical protein
MAACRVGHNLRIEVARTIETGSIYGENGWRGGKGQKDRRTASGTKSVRLLVSTIRNDVPEFYLTRNLDPCSVRKRQVGTVPCTTPALAIEALAVVLQHGRIGHFIANRAAGAATAVGCSHIKTLSVNNVLL